jgi:ketosteroid isomerase-like protein
MTTNIDIVRAHYAASAQNNIDGMMVDVSPQVHWTEMAGFPCAGTWVGPQAVVDNVFAVLGRDWIDDRFELQHLIDADDQIVGIGTYRGIYRATGKEIQARVAHVWKLQNQQIVEFEQFTDTLLVHQAMH